MKKPEFRLTRGQWRVWLQGVIASGLLDRLPPCYDRDDSSSPRDSARVAQEFLAALRDPNISRHALTRLAAELEQFRSWVESCQKKSRQIILAENETSRTDPRWLERWAASMIAVRAREPVRTAHRPAFPGSHPMWDDELDA